MYRQKFRVHSRHSTIQCYFNDEFPNSKLQSRKRSDSVRTHARTHRLQKKLCVKDGEKLERKEVTLSEVEAILIQLSFISATHHLEGNPNEPNQFTSKLESFFVVRHCLRTVGSDHLFYFVTHSQWLSVINKRMLNHS